MATQGKITLAVDADTRPLENAIASAADKGLRRGVGGSDGLLATQQAAREASPADRMQMLRDLKAEEERLKSIEASAKDVEQVYRAKRAVIRLITADLREQAEAARVTYGAGADGGKPFKTLATEYEAAIRPIRAVRDELAEVAKVSTRLNRELDLTPDDLRGRIGRGAVENRHLSGAQRSFGLNSARMVQDAAMFGFGGQFNPQMGLMSIANNLDMVLADAKESMAELRREGKQGADVFRGMLGTFTGAAGLLFAVNAVTAGIQLWPAIAKAFASDMDKATQRAKELARLEREALEGAQTEFGGIEDVPRMERRKARKERELAEREALVRALESEATILLSRANTSGSSPDDNRLNQINAEIKRQRELIGEVGENAAGLRGDIDKLQSDIAKATGTAEGIVTADEEEARSKQREADQRRLLELEVETLRIRWENSRDDLKAKEEYLTAKRRLNNADIEEEARYFRAMRSVAVREGNEVDANLYNSLLAELDLRANASDETPDVGGPRTDWAQRLREMRLTTRRANLDAAGGLLGQRIESARLTLEEARERLSQELEAFKGSEQQRAAFAEEVRKQELAAVRRFNRERLELAREHLRNLSELASQYQSALLDNAAMAAELLPSRVRPYVQRRLSAARRVRDAESALSAEMGKDTPDAAIVAQKREQVDLAKALFAQTMQQTQAEQALAEAMEGTARAARLRAAARGVTISRFRRSFAGRRMTGADEVELYDLEQAGRVEAENDAYEQQQIALREQYVGDKQRLASELEALEAEHQAHLTQIVLDGEAGRIGMLQGLHRERVEGYVQVSTNLLSAISDSFEQSAQMFYAARQRQLREQGMSEEEASRKAEKEARSRFEIGKALAIAETVISTYSSAQKAYEWGVKWGGPVAGTLAAAAAAIAGAYRVQAIRAQNLGGQATFGGDSGATYGVQGGGSPQPLGAGVGASTRDAQRYGAPVVRAVIDVEKQGMIVKQGSTYNADFTR